MDARVLVMVALAAVFTGCDQDIITAPFERMRSSSSQRQKAESQQLERDAADRLQAERQFFRMRLSTAATVVSNESERIARDIDKVSSDRLVLSERIKCLSGRGLASNDVARVGTILALLDDDAVNELALRYLGHDFRLVRLELSDAVADLDEKKRQREAALAANKAVYDEQLKDARAEKNLARESIQQAKEKLRKEISDYEDRSLKLKKKLQLVSVSERKQLQSELNAINSQLSLMRSSYDGMRSNRAATDDRLRVGREEERRMDSASRRWAAEDDRVRRRFAGQKDPRSVVSEYEASTVRALEKTMSERIVSLRGLLTFARQSQVGIMTMSTGVDRLDGETLKKARVELDGLVEKVSSSN